MSILAPNFIVIHNSPYLKNNLLLEIGPLAWLPGVPTTGRTISLMALEVFSHIFQKLEAQITVIKPERTFWER